MGFRGAAGAPAARRLGATAQMPVRSGLPSRVRGVGAVMFGLPSLVRGIFGDLYSIHCAEAVMAARPITASNPPKRTRIGALYCNAGRRATATCRPDADRCD